MATKASSSCGTLDCAHCPARGHSIFSQLGAVELEAMSADKGSKTYGRGEVIFYADDRPSGVFCIHQGRVKIYKLGKDGREQIIRFAGGGDIMGYRSLLGGEKYGVYAEALEPTRVCHIPKASFSSILTGSYDLSARLMGLLAQELKSAEEKIVDLALKPVSERVAETLLLLKDSYGMQQDQVTIDISLTRFDLANYVGAATESVSRQLSKFKSDGIIDVAGRKIKIMNHRALMAAAHVSD